MSNLSALELKKIVINYLKENESEEIYGTARLQDILLKDSEPPKQGLFGMLKKQVNKPSFFSWNGSLNSEDVTFDVSSVLSERSQDIYCILGNEIGFVDDQFFFMKGIHNGFNSKSLLNLNDFVKVGLDKSSNPEWPRLILAGYSVYASKKEEADDPYGYRSPSFWGCDPEKAAIHLSEIQELFKS